MPTRKIEEIDHPWETKSLCRDKGHEVPSHQVFEPGLYEHTCPSCGEKKVFRVDGVTCSLTPTEVDQGLYVLGNVYDAIDDNYFADSPLNSGILSNKR